METRIIIRSYWYLPPRWLPLKVASIIYRYGGIWVYTGSVRDSWAAMKWPNAIAASSFHVQCVHPRHAYSVTYRHAANILKQIGAAISYSIHYHIFLFFFFKIFFFFFFFHGAERRPLNDNVPYVIYTDIHNIINHIEDAWNWKLGLIYSLRRSLAV